MQIIDRTQKSLPKRPESSWSIPGFLLFRQPPVRLSGGTADRWTSPSGVELMLRHDPDGLHATVTTRHRFLSVSEFLIILGAVFGEVLYYTTFQPGPGDLRVVHAYQQRPCVPATDPA